MGLADNSWHLLNIARVNLDTGTVAPDQQGQVHLDKVLWHLINRARVHLDTGIVAPDQQGQGQPEYRYSGTCSTLPGSTWIQVLWHLINRARVYLDKVLWHLIIRDRVHHDKVLWQLINMEGVHLLIIGKVHLDTDTGAPAQHRQGPPGYRY